MMTMARIVWIGSLLVAVGVGVTLAQSNGGQFCVRAFEDANGNGSRDPGEALIQSGFSANLQNAGGVVIDSASIEQSDTRASGLICFQGLPAGDYGLFVTSAVYQPTASDRLTASIQPGELPALLEFGAQRIDGDIDLQAIEAANTSAQAEDDAALERLAVSTLGAVGAMFVTLLIGLLLYIFVMRPPRSYQSAAYPVEGDPYARFRPPSQRPGHPPRQRQHPPDDESYPDSQDFT